MTLENLVGRGLVEEPEQPGEVEAPDARYSLCPGHEATNRRNDETTGNCASRTLVSHSGLAKIGKIWQNASSNRPIATWRWSPWPQ